MKTQKNNYKRYIRRGLTLAAFSLVACAKVDFAQSPSGCTGNTCTQVAGISNYNYNITGSGQPIDILFVVDNSASMANIQKGIAAAFGSSLFSIINQYDYHLAITTTDISDAVNNPPRTVNQSGALQDGKLIKFSNGASFLTGATTDVAGLFSTAISRPESISCDAWVAANCPVSGCAPSQQAAYAQACVSGDTRGIYAANMTLANDATGFLRSNAPLAIVIISNADERANGGQIVNLPLTALDFPQHLKDTALAKGKKMAAYPIIIKPGDTACYNAQIFSASLFGYYGNTYNSLAGLTGGVVGSVCDASYNTALQNIGSGIVNNQMKEITLKCTPDNGTVTVTDSNGTSQVLSVSTANSKILQLPYSLLPNQTINLKYSCSSM